ncbi:MAG: hypothetical protein EWV62_00865 [Microcystis aeruginosa Ma_OC_LR_19540900_S633]|nr:MAG: hypothetical protein EWV62_00865 [Microcystis aeruginosa Ma_OC_LR_19540900_S633]
MTGNNKGNDTESGYLYCVKTFPEKRSIVSLKVYNLSKASIKLQSSQYIPKKPSGFQEQMLWLLLQIKRKLSATTLIFVNNVP